MFLATTADQRFWNPQEKTLFLGEWCKRYRQRHVWSRMDYQTLPYHWNDRKKLYKDFIFLNQVYERCLLILSDKLNNFHGVDHSTRYWRIVIGPWLNHFTAIFYDRYLSIISAIETRKISNTWIPSWEPSDCVPIDFASWMDQQNDPAGYDEYNLYLYSWLIHALGEIPFEVRSDIPPLNLKRLKGATNLPIFGDKSNLEDKLLKPFKHLLKRFLSLYGKVIPDCWNEIFFVSVYLNKRDLASLQISLGMFPNLVSLPIFSEETPVNPEIRKMLAFELGGGQFESLLCKIIPIQIPTVYLEGYSNLRDQAFKNFPKKPKVIFTTNALYGNEGFKIWAAEKVESQAKLVGCQHGGGYGSRLWDISEQHEIKVSDRYFTWGWADKTKQKEVSVPASQLIRIKEQVKFNPRGGILWVTTTFQRYFYRMMSFPTSSTFLDYFSDQVLFAKSVSPEVFDLLTVRLDPNLYGWDEKERWLDINPLLKVYRGNKKYSQHLSESRLSINTYNSTTFLETFVANFPTIIFWSSKYFELRNSAEPYYDDLRKVGILHDSPESAADKVNEIFEDPMSWWMSNQVQVSKEKFCHRFANKNTDWKSKWKKELLKIYNEVG